MNPRNKGAIVIHRINECDERKGTKTVNRRLFAANRCADHTVFIGSWLIDLFKRQGFYPKHYSVILNGADTKIFNNEGYVKWNHKDKLKIVTHHWGGNWRKGFDIYKKLDDSLNSKYKNRIEFTYIGQLPAKFKFKNTIYIKPKNGKELALLLKQNHVYLTASQNEPAGMHHIEGALCGLPLLYRNSGALPEYCKGFGIQFDTHDFEEKIDLIIKRYDYFADKMKYYPHTSEKMCEEYYQLVLKLLSMRDTIIINRGLTKVKAYKNIFISFLYEIMGRLEGKWKKILSGFYIFGQRR